MSRVVISGHTVSATRFAELTGVSRERLRTWERRHRFPEPVRVAGGPRRYPLDAVQRVLAVRRASEAGVPIAQAIVASRPEHAADHLAPETFEALVEHVPVPVAGLSGPAPLSVEFVNAAIRGLPAAPRPGEELAVALPAFHGSPCASALQRLFATDAGPLESEHPAWDGHPRHTGRSTLFRLPVVAGARPLIAMVGLEGEGERAARVVLADRERELADIRARHERHTRWLDAIAALADEFRREPGRAAIDNALDILVRQTNAVDGTVALHITGQLVLARSRRGILPTRPVTVAAHPELARCLRDGAPAWLGPVASGALGVPPDLHASAMPVTVAGEPLGMLLFLFNEVEPHDADNGRLLAAASAGMGFALLRDRLTQELHEAAGAAG
jgi:MerR family transcriptional regulator, light-induced transcriptional regulator